MRALFLNCSLKASPERSHTEALIRKSARIFRAQSVETKIVRMADHAVAHGIEEDMGGADAWPSIFAEVMAAPILVVATPIWLGERSSIASKVVERLYAASARTNRKGQYVYYGKVGGAIVTGNEDGGKAASRSILYALQHIGFLIPPQADAYWVGEAGPGPSYIDAGQKNAFTRRNVRIMTWNLLHLARMLKRHPIPSRGNRVAPKRRR